MRFRIVYSVSDTVNIKHPLDEEEYDGMGSLIMWHSFVKDYQQHLPYTGECFDANIV